mmetsp:Transcript_18985/g.48412  ORF Transcript_18985/g.48412 Transcript_18985/m.48412 type:complete len:323 (-) Transcript_18985:964-1932(-)
MMKCRQKLSFASTHRSDFVTTKIGSAMEFMTCSMNSWAFSVFICSRRSLLFEFSSCLFVAANSSFSLTLKASTSAAVVSWRVKMGTNTTKNMKKRKEPGTLSIVGRVTAEKSSKMRSWKRVYALSEMLCQHGRGPQGLSSVVGSNTSPGPNAAVAMAENAKNRRRTANHSHPTLGKTFRSRVTIVRGASNTARMRRGRMARNTIGHTPEHHVLTQSIPFSVMLVPTIKEIIAPASVITSYIVRNDLNAERRLLATFPIISASNTICTKAIDKYAVTLIANTRFVSRTTMNVSVRSTTITLFKMRRKADNAMPGLLCKTASIA